MNRALLLVLFCISVYPVDAQVLLPFQDRGLWGYRNANTEWVIEPQYEFANFFSEGVAPVRMNGYYQYIDGSGIIVSSIFEYASTFEHQRANVYVDGGWWIIDRNFNPINKEPYKSISSIDSNFFKGNSDSQIEIFNRDGKILVTCSSFQHVTSGKYRITTHEDSVPKQLLLFADGTYRIEVADEYDHQQLTWDSYLLYSEDSTFCINQFGDTLFSFSQKEYHFPQVGAYQFPVSVYWMHDSLQGLWLSGLKGVMNSQGEFTPISSDWRYGGPMMGNRGFARIENGKYVLVNSFHEVISNMEYDEVASPLEREWNSAQPLNSMVRKGQFWWVIDSEGELIHSYIDTLSDIHHYLYSTKLNIGVFYSNNGCYAYHFSSDVLYGPFTRMYSVEELNGACVFLGPYEKVFFLESGEIVSADSFIQSNRSNPINIISRLEFNFRETQSENRLDETKVDTGIQVLIDVDQWQWSVDSEYLGYQVWIVNNCPDFRYIDRENQEFSMTIEALDIRDGLWKPIHGDSFKSVLSLDQQMIYPHEKFSYVLPRMTGAMETSLRLRLDRVFRRGQNRKFESRVDTVGGKEVISMTMLINSLSEKSPHYRPVYSNEIPVRINPQQFWSRSVLEME
ncbi:MAG: WG repeat-containing protein [Bacteroidetes bacterium]|nr:MAG: WG repeat-containing protein [Bacteroidota bacterium]